MTVDGYSLEKYGSYFPNHTELRKGKEVTIKNKMPNDPQTLAEIKRQQLIESERLRMEAEEKERKRLAKLAAEEKARLEAIRIAKEKAEAARLEAIRLAKIEAEKKRLAEIARKKAIRDAFLKAEAER
jgi:membrane protein involved in colicin uptake